MTATRFSPNKAPTPPSIKNAAFGSIIQSRFVILPRLFYSTARRASRRAELVASRLLTATITTAVVLAIAVLPLSLLYLPIGCYVLVETTSSYLRECQAAIEEKVAARLLRKREIPANVYTQLESDEFRLLILEPGIKNDEIRCQLRTCNYSAKIPYTALSYAWGDATKVEKVQCNGKEIGIASNLHQALLDLRDADRERVLWIDALCINQDDISERGHQVRNMKQIYAQARQVLVWLGPEDDAISKAFDILRELKPTFVEPKNLLTLGFKPSYFSASNLDQRTIGFNFAMADESQLLRSGLDPLITLLERPWFRRLWVLQEVAHAKHVTLVSGRATLHWKLLARPVRDLYHSGMALDSITDKAKIGVLSVIEMENARQPAMSRHKRRLLSVLLATHAAECSDIRDKIYAILNLADDYDPERDIDIFGPDYLASPKDAFTRFARWSVARGDLDILSCTTRADVPAVEDLDRLPSWVPDWTRIDNETPFVRYRDIIPFSAASALVGYRPRVTDDDKLILSGVVVDVVKAVGPLSTFTKAEAYEKLTANQKWLNECLDLGYRIHQGPFSNHTCRKAFWRTITAGLTGEGHQAPHDFGLWFHKYLKSNYGDVGRRHTAAVESTILMWASNRRLAVTEGGRMALVPNSTKQGDIIGIIAGARVPHILRTVSTSGEHHIALGEAFVDELMDGRFLQLMFERENRCGKSHAELIRDFVVV